MESNSQKTVNVHIGQSLNESDLERVFGRIGPLKRCFIIRPKSLKNIINTGFVTYTTHENALEAIKSIKEINNQKVEVRFSVRKQNDAEQKKVFNAIKNKKFRLIVRNVPFELTLKELTEKFSSYGKLLDVTMPKKGQTTSGNRGFAFVQYSTKEEAFNAIKGTNATQIKGRPIAVDWAISKVKYDIQSKNLKQGLVDENEDKLYDNVLNSIANTKSNINTETVLKKKPEQQININEDITKEILKPRSIIDHKSVINKSKPLYENTMSNDVDENKTLFIRNVPLESNSDDLKKLFKNYGKIEYAIMNSFDGMDQHKGMGFVKFVDQESAKKCLRAYNESQGKKSPLTEEFSLFGKGGLLGPGADDIDDDSDQTEFSLRGQQLLVCMAVNKSKLDGLLNDRKRKFASVLHDECDDNTNVGHSRTRVVDKRSLHLLKEGSVKRCTSQYGELPQADAIKRSKLLAASQKKLKLLHYFVSPTRLTVHNLPRTVDKVKLREIFTKACNDPTARIKEARIMVNRNELNGQGVHPSLGFGFVEFDKHHHALTALRNVDNNPTTFATKPDNKDGRRAIVQFSVENMLALKLQKARQEKAQVTQSRQRLFTQIPYPNPIPPSDQSSKVIDTSPGLSKSRPSKKDQLDFPSSKVLPVTGKKARVNQKVIKNGENNEPEANFANINIVKEKTKKKIPVIKKSSKTVQKSKLPEIEEMSEIDERLLCKRVKKIHEKLFAGIGSHIYADDDGGD